MSLIQAALNKTQNKISASPERKQSGVSAPPRVGTLKNLSVLDQEVEKKILEVQKSEREQARQRTSHKPLILFGFLGLLFSAGIIYWSQQSRVQTEPVPPLVVSIERHPLPAKSKEEMKALFPKAVPVVGRPLADVSGLFFLSGIAGGGKEPYAVINGQILRVGEIVDKKAIVQSIESDHVLLAYQGETIRLALKH